jgi:hypothetical protein
MTVPWTNTEEVTARGKKLHNEELHNLYLPLTKYYKDGHCGG